MIVTLNADNQFGENGPQTGARGRAYEIRHVREESQTMVLVEFPGFDEATGYWCLLDHLLWPYTSQAITFYSTTPPEPEEVDAVSS